MKQSVKVCPNCDAENADSAEECAFCGEDLTEVEPEVDDDDTMEEPYDDTEDDDIEIYSRKWYGSKVARLASWITGIIGAASGVVLGDTFKAVTSHYNEYLKETFYDEAFNTGLMLSVWVATAVVVLGFVLCYFHFKNQETMLLSQAKTNKLLKKIANK